MSGVISFRPARQLLLVFWLLAVGSSVCYATDRPQNNELKKKACDFLSKADVESILGTTVLALTDNAYQCVFAEAGFTDIAPKDKTVQLSAWYWTSPQANSVDEVRKGIPFSRGTPPPPMVTKDLPNFADAAMWTWYGHGGTLRAFKGGTIQVEVTVGGLPEDVALRQAKALATKPLGGTAATGYVYATPKSDTPAVAAVKPLHASQEIGGASSGSVAFHVCNVGKADIDVFVSLSNAHIRPATCVVAAKSSGAMEPAHVGLAFTDSRGQYGAARRFDGVPYMGVKELPLATRLAMTLRRESVPTPPNVLSLATGSKTIQYRNVSVPLQLLFQPRFSECRNVATGGGATFGNTTIIERTTVCEKLGYTLTVEAYPDSHEISLGALPVGGFFSDGALGATIIHEQSEVNWAEEAAARKEREGQAVKWGDLLPALKRVRYPRPTIRDVLPRYIVIRGTVSSVEVDDTLSFAVVNFREDPPEPNFTRYKMCTTRLDILRDRFGADFRASMVGKPIEVVGDPGGDCNRELGMNILLAHHVRPVPSAQFDAGTRVWVPAPIVVKPAPPPPTIEQLAANIVFGARGMAADLEWREKGRMRAACVDQADKASAANPRNQDAINKEYFACKQAADRYKDPLLRDAAPAQSAVPAPAPVPGQDVFAALDAYNKALQEQRDRATQERMAAEQRLAEKAKPCAQELLKAYPDGGRSDPGGFQRGFQACVETLRASVSSAPVPTAAPISAPAAPAAAPAQPASR